MIKPRLSKSAKKQRFTARASEEDVKNLMLRQGIYCELGRDTSYNSVDIVAWGCVVIDVKESRLSDRGRFSFRLRSNHEGGRVNGHVFVLACVWDDTKTTYHVFPYNHSAFLKPDGEMKRGIIYTPHATMNKRVGSYGQGLSDDIMSLHENDWHYIEDQRIQIHKSLLANGPSILPKKSYTSRWHKDKSKTQEA